MGDAFGAFLDFLFEYLPMVFGLLIAAAIILVIWIAMAPGEPAGRCRTELGYMGQVEVTECEPSE